jgi:hypothetical protein
LKCPWDSQKLKQSIQPVWLYDRIKGNPSKKVKDKAPKKIFLCNRSDITDDRICFIVNMFLGKIVKDVNKKEQFYNPIYDNDMCIRGAAESRIIGVSKNIIT